MTFKHKLSKRLALLRGALLAVAGAFVACTTADSGRSVSGPATPGTAPSLAGGTVLFQENFEDASFAARGWYDNTAMTTTDTTHATGSTHALEVHFRTGATTPTWGGAARHLFTASPTLYVSYWVRYSSNWVGSGRPYHPHEFNVLSDMDGDWDGPSNNYLTLYIEENYQNGGIPRLAMQDNKTINTSYGAPPINLVGITENRSTGGCNGVVETQLASECYNAPPWYNDKKVDAALPYFSPLAGPGYKGNWNHVETYFQLNSIAGGIGQADGVMQYWFNGQLVIDRHDILFRTGARPNINFHQFIIAPYMGDGSPVDQTMWVDNLTLATAPLADTTVVTNPATVTDLSATAATDTSATLSFTEVNDGSGQPASYNVRYAAGTMSWGSAADATRGTCSVPMAGTTIGARRTCTVLGLTPGTAYQFQLVSFRGTLNVNAVFGGLSNVASASTTVPAIVPVASVTLSPTSVSQAVGATKQFTATLKDAGGNVLTGRTVTWASSNAAVATVSASGLEQGITSGAATITATSEGKSRAAALTVTVSKPGAVSNLSVSATTNNSATLTFTEVGDGTGHPASYEVRFAAGTINWGSASVVSQGTCAVPVVGTTIGATRSCTVLGLAASRAYQFRLVAYRGTLNVNAVFGALSNVAGGTTTNSTVPVASVTVTPASATLSLGGSQQLSATLKDASGNTLTGRSVSWTSSAPLLASVSGTGMVSGLLAGLATITATSEGMNGTAGITVASSPPPPGGWPNEPSGWTTINDNGMSGLNTGGWANVYPADITSGGISVTSDPTAPASPSSVWQFAYPSGFTAAGYAPATEWMAMAPTQALYVGFWWKPSNPWQGHESAVNKLMFAFTGDPAGLSQNMTIQLYGSGNGPFSTRMVGEGFEDVPYWENVGSTSPLALGVWHRVEILMNSPAGSLRWWVDGKLVGSYGGVPYPSYGFFQLEFSPTWGGVGSLAKQENDYFWFDQVHVSHP